MESSVAPDVAKPSRRRLVAWMIFVLSLVALGYGSRFLEEPAGEPAYRYATSISFAIQGAVVGGIVFLIARGLPLRDAFALRRPISWPVAGGLAVLTFVGIYVVGAILDRFLDPTEEQGLVPEDWDPARAGAFVAFFLSATIVAPLVEEMTYRGLGFTLLAPYGTWVAVIVTSILFSAAHGLVEGFPVLAIFGFFLAVLRAKTASIYPPLLLHAMFNAIALTVSVIA